MGSVVKGRQRLGRWKRRPSDKLTNEGRGGGSDDLHGTRSPGLLFGVVVARCGGVGLALHGEADEARGRSWQTMRVADG